MGKHNKISNVEVPHVQKVCPRCHIPYMIIVGSDNAQTCPYCTNEFYMSDILEQKKIIAELKKENEAVKRSNAALRGVITKLQNKENQALPAQECGTEPYEVDLYDKNNYDLVEVGGPYSCPKCDYPHKEGDSTSCNARGGCPSYYARILKPNIKADLESGKAVAKGGK